MKQFLILRVHVHVHVHVHVVKKKTHTHGTCTCKQVNIYEELLTRNFINVRKKAKQNKQTEYSIVELYAY